MMAEAEAGRMDMKQGRDLIDLQRILEGVSFQKEVTTSYFFAKFSHL